MTLINDTQAAAKRSLLSRLGVRVMPVLAALVTVAAVLGSADAAQAKQCVWNKGWFALTVQWYDRDDMVVATLPGGKRDVFIKHGARMLRSDTFPAAQGRCYSHPRGERAVAVVRIWGGEFFTDFAKGFFTPLIAGGAAAVNATVCTASAGAACPAAIAGTGAAAGLFLHSIPKRSEVFGIVIPRTDRWTDVWGSAFSPQVNINVGGRF